MTKYLFVFIFLSVSAFAMPSGPVVTSGMVEFYEEENYLEIIAHNRSVIEWESFSIGANEVVKFIQPGDKAIVTNQIIGEEPSEIFGRMEANGKVYIINSSGLQIDEHANVIVGGIWYK